ncbi:MAG: DUF1287 domain-containing protein [Candidatus Sedimenticola sp. 6PFRAG5]
MNNGLLCIALFCNVFLLVGCGDIGETAIIPRLNEPNGFSLKLSESALERINYKVEYDPSYKKIDYPNGDVNKNTGVCTDVVIRSYRTIGIDIQKDLHEDLAEYFDAYPSKRIWGLNKSDKNIDHRRVPNLKVFFARKGVDLSVTSNPEDYLPGDLVTWSISGSPHIGIVVNRKRKGSARHMIVHNIGNGPELEDMLFRFQITGHYRYYGALAKE